ncbi:MAG: hypothetical protein ACK2UE_05005 [Anaerolineales bacterium]|jgi:hypothetical protein
MMNGFYIQAVKEDRERDLRKYQELNRIYRDNKVLTEHPQDAARRHLLISGLTKIGKRIRDVFSSGNGGGIEVLD